MGVRHEIGEEDGGESGPRSRSNVPNGICGPSGKVSIRGRGGLLGEVMMPDGAADTAAGLTAVATVTPVAAVAAVLTETFCRVKATCFSWSGDARQLEDADGCCLHCRSTLDSGQGVADNV